MIGGVERSTAPMSLKQWRRAWPVFEKVKDSPVSDLEAMDAMVTFISVALEKAERPEDRLTPDQIEENLFVAEFKGLNPAVLAILSENGFGSGEDKAVDPTETDSTATLTA